MRLSIGSKLAAGFGMALLILLGIGGVAYYDTKKLVEVTASRAQARQFLWNLEQIVSLLRGAENEQRGYILTGDARHLEAFRSMIAACGPTLDNLKKIEPTLTDDIEALRPIVATRAAELERGIEVRNSEGLAAAAALAAESSMAFDQLQKMIARLSDAEQVRLTERAAEAKSTAARTSMTIGLGMLVAFILVTFAGVMITRGITGPARALVEGAQRIGRGDFSFRIDTSSRDEIGDLAASFNEMARSLEAQRGAIADSGTALTGGVTVMSSGSDLLLSRSQEQLDLASDSAQSLSRVHDEIADVFRVSDRVSAQTQDSASRASELQASSEAVRHRMDELFESVASTSASTLEMSASASEMSDMMTKLSDSGNVLLSFVSEMESTTRELESSARTTSNLSQQAQEDAAAGRRAVDATVEGIERAREITEAAMTVISELAARTKEIETITGVIAAVTDRTNLLALNAAIIAAQAGEHGKAFGIVAEEMRGLADQTRGSTDEIGEIIVALQKGSRQAVEAIQQGVDLVRNTVGLAKKASDSLDRIVTSSNESGGMAEQISLALQEQADATRRLHGTTSEMADLISQNMRAIQEQSHGAGILAREADQVHGIAAHVKNASEEQVAAARGIASAMEAIDSDARRMRDLLERQLPILDSAAAASATMRDIAQQNNALAGDFTESVRSLAESSEHFTLQVGKLQIARERQQSPEGYGATSKSTRSSPVAMPSPRT